jgi:hypothetical protein
MSIRSSAADEAAQHRADHALPSSSRRASRAERSTRSAERRNTSSRKQAIARSGEPASATAAAIARAHHRHASGDGGRDAAAGRKVRSRDEIKSEMRVKIGELAAASGGHLEPLHCSERAVDGCGRGRRGQCTILSALRRAPA